MHNIESAAINAELEPPFTIAWPAVRAAPVVFCSPHSGNIYPKVLLEASRLDAQTLRKSEDCHVDRLFMAAASLGAPLLSARFPRAYLDVNREPYELDPALFIERPPAYANTQSLRVVGGLGTIARIVAESEEIYRSRMPIAVAFERIDKLYKPFHAALAELLQSTREEFGRAVLIDCHSMPSTSMSPTSGTRPDFVIGDRFGASCSPRLTRLVRDVLSGQGYQVQLNRPYAGGYITEHYGRPAESIHALQIEINRSLYMNETTLEIGAGFERLSQALVVLADRLFGDLETARHHRIAAE